MSGKLTSKALAHEANLDDPEYLRLITLAAEADAVDSSLTVRQALIKYKKAVFWALFLSTTLVMEGFDLINSFYGQTQFANRFGSYDEAAGKNTISPSWQSGLSNSSAVGQIIGLAINGFVQDRYGCRPTMLFFLVWMGAFLFIPIFATSLPMLAVGEAFCGISWGVFQTLSTVYASEVAPTILRPYLTAYVCMCWGAGILLSSGVIRAVVDVQGDMGYRSPPCLHPTHYQSRSRKTKGATYLECFKGTNARRTEINMVVWAAQILCGNAILGFSVVFLQAAGFSEIQAFNVNISLSACYIIGGIISWFLMFRLGRATLYIGGLAFMFLCLVAIGALGFVNSTEGSLAVGILLVISTLANMITTGPICYPIVAETPSGRLRYKTISIGRITYNLTGIFSNSVTPRMISAQGWGWGAKTGFFYAGTNLLCLIWCWFRLPETKDRSFGEIDILFENHVPARKFKYTQVDQFTSEGQMEKMNIQDEIARGQAMHIDTVDIGGV